MARLTPEQIQRIDAALDATKGSRTQAAIVLGLEPVNISDAIRFNPVLKAKWSNDLAAPPAPGLDTEIDRPTPAAIAAEKVVAAINKQDSLVERKGAALPGFSKKEQKFFAALMTTYAGTYKTAADFTHSGAVHAAGCLVSALEEARERLKDIEDNPNAYTRVSQGMHGESVTKMPAEFWNDTMNMIVKITDALRKMNQSVLQSNELRLRIDKLKQSQTKEVKAEAGWEVASG